MTFTKQAIFAIIIVFAAVVAIAVIGPAACNKIRSQGAQNRLNEGQTGALTNSAADAVATQGKANARERSSEDLTRSNDRDIRNAEGASDQAKPAVDSAGRRALCLRDAYRDRPECRVQPTPPR